MISLGVYVRENMPRHARLCPEYELQNMSHRDN